MSYSIGRELARFASLSERLNERYDVEPMCDHGFKVSPRRVAVALPTGKSIGLAMMGIIHGNEWAGIAVLNGLMAHLVAGTIMLEIPLAFIAGNPPAAHENKRFLDRDLNRCFARTNSAGTREERRAEALASALQGAAYLVDFHQTSRRSTRPFFIFPFNRKSFELARDIAPRQTIVTHWGKPFSSEGMCSDEYVNSQGGVGISLELGENGFDPYQIASGIDSGVWAIRAVTAYLDGSGNAKAQRALRAETEAELGPVYTWAEIMPWPEAGVVDLDDGWYNFRDVVAGQRLGVLDGQTLTSTHGGKMLFPKYLTREQQAALDSRPTELCRVMRQIPESDLPA